MVEPDISTRPERSVPDPHWSEHSGAQRYSGAKATKVPEKDGRESERFIVPWKPGNLSQGTRGREGSAVSWNFWRERWRERRVP